MQRAVSALSGGDSSGKRPSLLDRSSKRTSKSSTSVGSDGSSKKKRDSSSRSSSGGGVKKAGTDYEAGVMTEFGASALKKMKKGRRL